MRQQADYLIQGYRKGLPQALAIQAAAKAGLELEALATELVPIFAVMVMLILLTECRYVQVQAYLNQGTQN